MDRSMGSNGQVIGKRDPRQRDERYLRFLRTLPCCVCGRRGPSDAAHIRMSPPGIGKRPTGGGEKPHDHFAVPLCRPVLGVSRGCHAEQHTGSEEAFWRRAGKDPIAIAERLYRLGGGTPTTKRPRARAKIKRRSNPWPAGRKIQSPPSRPAKPQHSATRAWRPQ